MQNHSSEIRPPEQKRKQTNATSPVRLKFYSVVYLKTLLRFFQQFRKRKVCYFYIIIGPPTFTVSSVSDASCVSFQATKFVISIFILIIFGGSGM
jgi:hypothetical protein